MHFRTHKNKSVKNEGLKIRLDQFDSFKFDGRERKNNAANHQKTAYGKASGVPEVILNNALSVLRHLYCIKFAQCKDILCMSGALMLTQKQKYSAIRL